MFQMSYLSLSYLHLCRQREIVAGLQLLANTVVQEISGDREGDDLIVTHLSDGRIEVTIQGTGEDDLVLHIIGGWKITLTHIGGRGISPCQLVMVAIQDKAKIPIPMGWPVRTKPVFKIVSFFVCKKYCASVGAN
ncbi:hypothetical protein D0Y65_028235 [Glycine soja]|uniref:Uncharacterized protein n=1 Tax=Glycine soja TaxID=3848 RepID=A0A445ITJ3_GLYSO|nr:hypothetical protein D0Y65_028235 [Glycine soja]